jgi:hypothetical protein
MKTELCKCNNCDWQGEEEDLMLIEFDIYDEYETPTATEDKNGFITRIEVEPKKSYLN